MLQALHLQNAAHQKAQQQQQYNATANANTAAAAVGQAGPSNQGLSLPVVNATNPAEYLRMTSLDPTIQMMPRVVNRGPPPPGTNAFPLLPNAAAADPTTAEQWPDAKRMRTDSPTKRRKGNASTIATIGNLLTPGSGGTGAVPGAVQDGNTNITFQTNSNGMGLGLGISPASIEAMTSQMPEGVSLGSMTQPSSGPAAGWSVDLLQMPAGEMDAALGSAAVSRAKVAAAKMQVSSNCGLLDRVYLIVDVVVVFFMIIRFSLHVCAIERQYFYKILLISVD